MSKLAKWNALVRPGANVLLVVQSNAWQRALRTSPKIAPELMLSMYPTLLDVLSRTARPIGRCYTAVELDHPTKNRSPLNRRSKLITPSAMKGWIKATKRRVKPTVSILVTDKPGWQSSETLKQLATEGIKSTYVLRYKHLDESQWAGDTNEYGKAVKNLYQNRPRISATTSTSETVPAASSGDDVTKAICPPGTDQRPKDNTGIGLRGMIYGIYKRL